MSQFITHTNVNLPVSLTIRIADFFQAEEQIAVEWLSPEKKEVTLFSGLYSYEKGASETFIVRGKPGYCTAVLKELGTHGTIIDKRPQNSSVKFWIHLSGRRT